MLSEVWNPNPKRSWVSLTTYITNETGQLNMAPRPAVLICPGGGFFSCSDREAEPVALRFNAIGYHAFVLRYSVYSKNKGGFSMPDFSKEVIPDPDTAHPAPLQDIGCAMKLIREMSEEWNVDMDRVAVCGFSAGAQNAALYATRYMDPVVTDYVGLPAKEIAPAAQILGYMVSDFVLQDKTNQAIANPMLKAFCSTSDLVFFGRKDRDEELLKDASPAYHVKKDTVPAFLWATAHDSLVPVQQTLTYANALATANVPFELHIFEDGDHGLASGNQASALALSQINMQVAEWMSYCEKWLGKRFQLNLPKVSLMEVAMRK